MRRFVVLLPLIGFAALLFGGALSPAHAASSTFSNPLFYTITESGPSLLTVGQPAAFTVVYVYAGIAPFDHINPTVTIPAGASNVTIADDAMFPAPQFCSTFSQAASPIAFSATPHCFGPVMEPVPGTPITLTITLTPTRAEGGALNVSAGEALNGGVGSLVSLTMPVQAQQVAFPSVSMTGGGQSQAPYGGSGWNPICLYGCPPGGQP